ncbi:MAG: hypothetical protein P1U57_00730 [Oleibacter sp.]|nr:hypothetical protein [Thalassolituus sp.]
MRIPWQKNSSLKNACLGIELNHGQVWAVLRTDRGVIESYIPESDEQGFDGLAVWLEEKNLGNLPTVVCLDVREYELHLVESPQVPVNELSAALSFRIAEFTGESANNKVLQAFPLPADAYRGRVTMSYAAITDRRYLQRIVDFCINQNLRLERMLINELSTLNVLSYIDPQSCIGVLRFEANSGVIYLYREGALYCTRQIPLGIDDLGLNQVLPEEGELSLQTSSRLDVLALEIQRSMDYFESQIGVGSVSELWLMKPDQIDISAVLGELEEQLNTPVRLLSLESIFNRQESTKPLTASLVMALGGALSYELAG